MPLIKYTYENGAQSDTVNYVNATVLGVLVTIFMVSLVVTVYLAYICTVAVPTDVLVSKQREMQVKNETFVRVWDDTGEPMDLFCNICDAYVQAKTKHCGPCNRCCEEFDHHCVWLNNCIGTQNYSNFRRLINVYLVFCIAYVMLFVQGLSNSLVSEDALGSVAAIVLLIFQTVVNAIVIAFDA